MENSQNVKSQEKSKITEQKILIENRKKITINGVEKLISIKEDEYLIDGNKIVFDLGIQDKISIDDMNVKKLKKSISRITNGKSEIFGQHGSADTRFYSKYNVPSVEFGPIGKNWHGDDEFVIIDSVYLYEQILMDFIKNNQ